MSDFVFVIEHDEGLLSPLTVVAGRSVLGHVLDQLRRIQPEARIAVLSKAPDKALVTWARRSRVEIIAKPVSDLLKYFGCSQLVTVSAHVAVLPHRDLFAAICLSSQMKCNVRVGDRADLPLGTFARITIENERSEPVVLPAHGAVTDSKLEAFVHSMDAATKLEAAINSAGRMPSDLQPGDASRLDNSPWKGPAGPLLIAEIGGNHEGDFETAVRITEQAINSGADCIKFQLYQGHTLVSAVEGLDRHKHFKKFELSKSQHIQLAKMCRDAGLIYLASVWDPEMLNWIDPYLDFYKVGSGDLTAWPILEDMAKRGKPILLSTGLATLDDVVQTIDYLRSVNPKYNQREMLCIMQCTSMYPIPDEHAHLRVMDALRSLEVAVGYSDHTIGEQALVAAAAMGAEVLEFHFTDRRENQSFRDHKVSLLKQEVSALKDQLGRIRAFRGSICKVPQKSELEAKHEVTFRRGVYSTKELSPGEKLSSDKLVCLRPAKGVDARDFDFVVGATVKRPIRAFASISEIDDLELDE